MVYTQARLDEALSAFRECKPYLERRGFRAANLESLLARKYDLRRPPTETVFATRPALWAGRDDDSDGDFNPAHGKKRKNITSEPRQARLRQKRKLSVSGDDSNSNRKKCRDKQRSTTWAQGRRLGRSMIEIFKFTKVENLEILKDLLAQHGRGKANMPQEQDVNVFNFNDLDSGLTPALSSKLVKDSQPTEKSERQAGTVIDPSVGIATPRGSIGSIDARAQADAPSFFGNLFEIADEPVRGLRNRAIPVTLPPKKRYGCLTCKEEQQKCSLLKVHPDYEGACDACEKAHSPCRINEDDEPRMGPWSRMAAESGKKKKHIEDKETQGRKRRHIGSNLFDEDDSRGLGTSILRKNHQKEGERLDLMSRLINHDKKSFPGQNLQSSAGSLSIGLAKGSHNHFGLPSSGYHKSLFTSAAPRLSEISMGNTLDTAISLSDSPSPPDSPISQDFDADPTTTISTSWAHPFSFQHQPKSTGLPCHFCDDYRYGFFGLGSLNVEVAWDRSSNGYLEIAGGHVAHGHEPTRMCGVCALERLRIRFCGHDCKGKRKEGDMEPKHRLVEMPAWRRGTQAWTAQLILRKGAEGYSGRPALPPCHLCMLPATSRCVVPQARNTALQPLKEGEAGKRGCGLRLCDRCRGTVEGAGRWDAGSVVGRFGRADAEFLFGGGLLEREWGDYLGSVGLL